MVQRTEGSVLRENEIETVISSQSACVSNSETGEAAIQFKMLLLNAQNSTVSRTKFTVLA
jgi:hypothetical protein